MSPLGPSATKSQPLKLVEPNEYAWTSTLKVLAAALAGANCVWPPVPNASVGAAGVVAGLLRAVSPLAARNTTGMTHARGALAPHGPGSVNARRPLGGVAPLG